MVENDYSQNIDKGQYGREKQNIFDDNLVEDVDSIQEPYPATDVEDSYDDRIDDETENQGEQNIHEYEDNDHPHEYRSPTAVIDDYKGASDKDSTNAFERQNPLQNPIPTSDRDK